MAALLSASYNLKNNAVPWRARAEEILLILAIGNSDKQFALVYSATRRQLYMISMFLRVQASIYGRGVWWRAWMASP